jgi:hypothetical protein
MALPPSSPSESSLLAFSYDRGADEVEYPHGHDQSEPQTPVLASTPGPINHDYPHSSGRAKAYPPRSLDPSRVSSHSEHMVIGCDEGYEIGTVARKQHRAPGDMDAFGKDELVAMGGCSLIVLVLLIVSVVLTFGDFAL